MSEADLRLMNVAEVSERLGVCRSKAYSVIKDLNKIMEARGFKTIPGRVSRQMLEEAYFGKTEEDEVNDSQAI